MQCMFANDKRKILGDGRLKPEGPALIRMAIPQKTRIYEFANLILLLKKPVTSLHLLITRDARCWVCSLRSQLRFASASIRLLERKDGFKCKRCDFGINVTANFCQNTQVV